MDRTLINALRQQDYERYVCALMEPAKAQPRLFALLLLNQELARAGQEASDPMVAAIRLKWWQEAAQRGDTRSHPLLAVVAQAGIHAAQVEALIAPRLIEAEQRKGFADTAQFDDYLQQSAGRLHQLLVQDSLVISSEAKGRREILKRGTIDFSGAVAPMEMTEKIKLAGAFYGLVGVLRSLPYSLERGVVPLPHDLLRQFGISPAAIEAGLEREAFAHLMAHFEVRLEQEASALRSAIPSMPTLVRRMHKSALLYTKALKRCGNNPAALPRRLPNLPLRLWIGV